MAYETAVQFAAHLSFSLAITGFVLGEAGVFYYKQQHIYEVQLTNKIGPITALSKQCLGGS